MIAVILDYFNCIYIIVTKYLCIVRYYLYRCVIIKKASSLDKKFSEDISFARETEEDYQRIKSGKGNSMDFDDFIEEMNKW